MLMLSILTIPVRWFRIFMTDLRPLIKTDGLTLKKYHDVDVYVHDEHRWVLPIISYLQINNNLPTPCNLIGFDYHTDTIDVSSLILNDIKIARANDLSVEKVIEICDSLDHQNHDWIKAGMELGMIDNAVIFGINSFDLHSCRDGKDYIDHYGNMHKIFCLSHIREELERGGRLVEFHQKNEIWDILGLDFNLQTKTISAKNTNKALLDIDLDCFTGRFTVSQEYIVPWPDEVYQDVFSDASTYDSACGISGNDVIREMLKSVGAITIAREPEHCGGKNNADIVNIRLNNHIFNGELN